MARNTKVDISDVAFCEEDKSLICISCILEGGYQSKKIVAIEDVRTWSITVGRQSRNSKGKENQS